MTMEMKFCQSCGMPLTDDNKGTNADGTQNEDYCIYCYKDGKFTQNMTMEQMIDHCAQFIVNISPTTMPTEISSHQARRIRVSVA